jgi:hypothetical protein
MHHPTSVMEKVAWNIQVIDESWIESMDPSYSLYMFKYFESPSFERNTSQIYQIDILPLFPTYSQENIQNRWRNVSFLRQVRRPSAVRTWASTDVARHVARVTRECHGIQTPSHFHLVSTIKIIKASGCLIAWFFWMSEFGWWFICVLFDAYSTWTRRHESSCLSARFWFTSRVNPTHITHLLLGAR